MVSAHCAGVPSCISCSNAEVTQPCAMTHSTSASVAASGSLPATPLMHAAVSHESAAPALALHEESPRQPVAAEEHLVSAHCAGVPRMSMVDGAAAAAPASVRRRVVFIWRMEEYVVVSSA